MAPQGYEAIQRNPKYQELVRTRTSFGWKLTIIQLLIYFAFILVIAYSPQTLGVRLGGSVMTVGLVIGVAVIFSAFIMVGIYIRKANATYDTLIAAIVKEHG